MKKWQKAYSRYFVVALVLCLGGLHVLNYVTTRAVTEANALEQQIAAFENAVLPLAPVPSTMAAAPIPTAPEQVLSIPEPIPEHTESATFIVPPGSDSLVPLEGWVDQPNKDRPGRVHTNLMVRRVSPSLRPEAPPRAPCLKEEQRPAERLKLSYGWVSLPARTVLVPCGSR